MSLKVNLKASARSACGESAIRGIDYTVSNTLWDHKKMQQAPHKFKKRCQTPTLTLAFFYFC